MGFRLYRGSVTWGVQLYGVSVIQGFSYMGGSVIFSDFACFRKKITGLLANLAIAT